MSVPHQPQGIVVRCRRFAVRVTLDAFGGLSPLEEHLLLGIAAGIATVDGIVKHLTLPKRLILDACVDLLHTGLVQVTQAGNLQLNPSVQQAIGDDPLRPSEHWTKRFISAAPPEPQTVVLLQELLSGALLHPPSGPERRQADFLYAPIHPGVSRLDDVPKLDLILAVGRQRRGYRDEDTSVRAGASSGRYRIRDARLMRRVTSSHPGDDETTIAVSLIARPSHWEPDSPPLFKIVGPDTIPVMARRRMAAALGELWQWGYGRGPRQFFDRLRIADSDECEPSDSAHMRHPRAALQELTSAWEDEREKPPLEVHEGLCEIERNVRDELDEALQYTAHVDPLHHPAARRTQVLEALGQARQQVVLGGDDLHHLACDVDLQENLAAAVKRGVTVHLLWSDPCGRDGVALDKDLAELVASLAKTPRGGGIVAASRPMAANTRLIICDLDWVYITGTTGSLEAVARSGKEFGIRISSHEAHGLARIVTEVLAWSRSLIPDFRLRPLLVDAPVLFAKRPTAKTAALRAQIPRPSDGPFGRLWHRLWQQRIDEFSRDFDNAMPLAVPVFDSDHRALLADAVETTQRRLLIESPHIGSAELSDWLCKALVNAVEHGVDVRIVHGEQRASGPTMARRWQTLTEAGAAVVQRPTRASVLISDDWCVVSDFAYLSRRPPLRRYVGVRIFAAAVTDTIFAALTR